MFIDHQEQLDQQRIELAVQSLAGDDDAGG